MKEIIEQYLRKDGHWKEFINEGESKDASLIDIHVITLEQEDENIYFDVSIIYFCRGEGQKQIIESGVGIICNAGILKKVSCSA